MNIFECDAFVKALQKGEKHEDALVTALCAVKKHLDKAMNNVEYASLAQTVESVADTYARISNIVNGTLALLLPLPEALGLSAKDSVPIVTHKGDSTTILETSLQKLFTEQKFWVKLVGQNNRAAATAKELFPAYRDIMQSLKDIMFNKKDTETPLALALFPHVHLALSRLEEFRAGFKPKATAEMEQTLLVVIPQVAKYIFSSKSVEGIDVKLLPEFVLNLQLLIETKDIQELVPRLQAWQANMAAEIAQERLHDYLKKLADDITQMDWNELGKVLSPVDDLADDCLDLLRKLLLMFATLAAEQAMSAMLLTKLKHSTV